MAFSQSSRRIAWDRDGECSAFANRAFHGHLAVVGFHDFVDNGKSEAGSFFLGCEIRIEDGIEM